MNRGKAVLMVMMASLIVWVSFITFIYKLLN